MTVLSPNSRYTNRINLVLNHANQNFGQNLQLESLAEIACLSKYHFTRVFNSLIGESPLQFIKRIRLEKASILAKNKHIPIHEIANDCGFSSLQSFSREFRNKFECCPRLFRLNFLNNLEDGDGVSYIKSRYAEFRSIGIEHDLLSSASKIELRKLSPTRVAYIRNIGSYGGSNGISNAMTSIQTWAQEVGLWNDQSELIGISWDYSLTTPDSLCRFDSCVPIPKNFSNYSGVSVQTLPGGLYAVAKMPYRSAKDLPKVWHWFSFTLRNSIKFKNYVARLYTGPWVEKYKPRNKAGIPEVELYVKLFRKNSKGKFTVDDSSAIEFNYY